MKLFHRIVHTGVNRFIQVCTDVYTGVCTGCISTIWRCFISDPEQQWWCLLFWRLFQFLPEETSGPNDCNHSRNTWDTDGTSSHLQHKHWCQLCATGSGSGGGTGEQTLWRTSLAECQTGIVIATVSLFGAAGCIIFTAVTTNGWSWNNKQSC